MPNLNDFISLAKIFDKVGKTIRSKIHIYVTKENTRLCQYNLR